MHPLIKPDGPAGQCYLDGSLKGQCAISKTLFPLVLSTFIEQNIFFAEIYNAFTISEPDFTVCTICDVQKM